MRKTKEVLRLRFELGLGQRQIARRNVRKIDRSALAGLKWGFAAGPDIEMYPFRVVD